MKKILPILFFVIFVLTGVSSFAQQNGIVKSYAFFRKSIAGSIPVDKNGNPTAKGVNKDYLFYIETKGNTLPKWEKAYIDGFPYTIQTVEVKQPSFHLGQLKEQRTPVILKKGNGNRLWQMVLTPQQSNEVKTASQTTTLPIILAGTYRGKAFTHKITKMQELAKQINP